MPHSSGGGSHGGGSHGGGSHGGSGRSSRRSTYFPGAHKYVYYKDNRPVYYYRADTIKTPEQRKKTNLAIGLFLAFFYVLMIVSCLVGSFHHPKKLDMNYDTEILIYDDIDVMTAKDEEQLREILEDFQNLTGITPAVITVPQSVWLGRYTTMENYAYDLYVNTFSDEKHWLIVYSEPEVKDGFNDWHWEGMQGDDTDPVLTQKWADTFTDHAHKYLLDQKIGVAEAFARAFSDLMPDIMKTSFQPVVLFAVFFILFHGALMYAGMFGARKKEAKIDDASIEIDAKAPIREDQCEYCQGIYVHGLHFNCPHCGAPIRPAQD